MLLRYQTYQLQLLLILFWIVMRTEQIVVYEDNTTASPDSSCTTPDRKRGTCRRWTLCKTLDQKIESWDEIRPYLCGSPVTGPKVCCPSPTLSNISDLPGDIIFPPDTYSGTENTASGNDFSIPRTNPSGSPNTRNGKPIFLPDDCGSSIFMLNRVIGGQKSVKGSWPWMVVLLNMKRNGSIRDVSCGGTLVTARHVITAAHCVVRQNSNILLDPKRLMVRVGVHDLRNASDPDVMDVAVDAIRIHEDYDLRIHTDDIAVLRLSQPVPFSKNTAPVCLPYGSLRYEDLTGKNSTVTGFGSTSVKDSDGSNVLMEVSFDIQDQEECRRIYEHELPITDVHLCAGTVDGSKDSCQGDSGGPLVIVGEDKRYHLIGIVSFGKNCAMPGYPGVYTRVTEYLDWLTPRIAD